MNAFERLAQIEQNCRVARVALAALDERSTYDPGLLHRLQLRPRDTQRCLANLEATFTVRMFAEFEAVAHRFWSTLQGAGEQEASRKRFHSARWPLNRLAARRGVSGDVLAHAHQARLYRNSLTHVSATPVQKMTIGQFRSALARFLGRLGRAEALF